MKRSKACILNWYDLACSTWSQMWTDNSKYKPIPLPQQFLYKHYVALAVPTTPLGRTQYKGESAVRFVFVDGGHLGWNTLWSWTFPENYHSLEGKLYRFFCLILGFLVEKNTEPHGIQLINRFAMAKYESTDLVDLAREIQRVSTMYIFFPLYKFTCLNILSSQLFCCRQFIFIQPLRSSSNQPALFTITSISPVVVTKYWEFLHLMVMK